MIYLNKKSFHLIEKLKRTQIIDHRPILKAPELKVQTVFFVIFRHS